MNKRIYPLFEFREEQLDLEKYEALLGFKFPPIFGAFLRNYKTSPKLQNVYLKRTEQEKKFIDSDFRLISTLAHSEDSIPISLEDDLLGLIEFKDIDSLVDFCVPEDEDMKDMIFISEHESSDVLLLGIGEHNQDKIFLYSEINVTVGDDWVVYFAENIFDILFKCNIVEFHYDKHHYKNNNIRRVESKRLYKNWGEDFWRMRAEKEES